VVAACDLREVLTPANIEQTFDFIDTDRSGGLSLPELRARLGGHIEDEYYRKIIRHFSRSSNGEVHCSNLDQQEIVLADDAGDHRQLLMSFSTCFCFS
jgi:Ca2+-binding EF-hand superfamily protein